MDVLSATASQWQAALQCQDTTSVVLVNACLEQITHHNRQGQHLNALINVAPQENVLEQARKLDEERAAGKLRSQMHGIPIIVKDIIPTDRSLGLPTTCGAYAFRSTYGKQNCPLAQRLVDAGLIIIGKSNLNEFCRLRDVKSGWSALGGQTQSPYITNGLAENEAPVGNSSASGSSSGSAVGVAAGFAPVAIGTETTGSVVVPAHRAGLYSLKVTNSRAPKEGVLSLSKEWDSIGAMTKSAEDLRHMTEIILGGLEHTKERRTPLRVGFVNPQKWRFPDEYCPLSKEIRDDLDEQYERFQETMRLSGKFEVVSNVPFDSEDIKYEGRELIGTVVDAQYCQNFAEFLASLTGTNLKSVPDLITYNEDHAGLALPKPFQDQKDLKRVSEIRETPGFVENAVEYGRKMAGPERIDKIMDECNVDFIVGPGDSTLFGFSTRAGYPIGSVPWTTVNFNDTDSRPEGLLVIGKANTEDMILYFMQQYEALIPERAIPSPLKTSV